MVTIARQGARAIEITAPWKPDEDQNAVVMMSMGMRLPEIAKNLSRPLQAVKDRAVSRAWETMSARYLTEHSELVEGIALRALANQIREKMEEGSNWDVGDLIETALSHARGSKQTVTMTGPELTTFVDMGAEVTELIREPVPEPDATSDSVKGDTHATPGSPPCVQDASHIDIRESVLEGQGDKKDEEDTITP